MSVDRLTRYGTFCQLLYALESARNRLAVAIASEGKRTIPKKWNVYIETEQRVLRCLRQLRCGTVTREASQRWRCALELLRAPSSCEGTDPSEASRICERLGSVLSVLEGESVRNP